MIPLDSSISELGKVGTALSRRLSRLGIQTCRDLVFYIPFRFEDYTSIVNIGDLKPGMQVTIHGQIRLINNRRSPRSRKMVTECLVADETGQVNVVWFNQAYITKNLIPGDYVRLSGKTNDNYFSLQMVSPTYKKIAPGCPEGPASLQPVYSLTEGVTQKQLQSLISQALSLCGGDIYEWMPETILHKHNLVALPTALHMIHAPLTMDQVTMAQRRLHFEELLLIQLAQIANKERFAGQQSMPIPFDKDYLQECINHLPFSLTEAQKGVLWDVVKDMEKESPMNRLLEGDVGSGKTAVAILSALCAMHAGHQVALMAPTEILARQHFLSWISTYGSDHTKTAGLWTSGDCRVARFDEVSGEWKTENSTRKAMIASVNAGEIDLIIGTHAIIQGDVQFADLALAIIDEQHRFGVAQRKSLKEKNTDQVMPHLLSMTATPIPRTLALTVYGDLDLSIIDQMPLGRKSIITKVTPARYRNWTYNFVREHIQKGEQAFVICPLIDMSDTLGVTSVTEEYERLKAHIFPDLRLEMLHGKMNTKEKEEIMHRMKDGLIDILISTSVVEVGVDIPNATIMLIEGAERFGLSQLHQFRGRVGRSDKQSYCFLLASTQEQEEVTRLRALAESTNGFELAERDLELRGMGDIYGTRQSGLPPVSQAALMDHALIKAARDTAAEIMAHLDQYPSVEQRLNTFTSDVHLE